MGKVMLSWLLLGACALASPAGRGSSPFDDAAGIALEDYLPHDVTEFDASVPRPSGVLGHELGEGYPSHHRVVDWFRRLAEASPRVSLVDLGPTFEGRPQITAVITSPGNQLELDRVLERHLDGNPISPVFTWHGYGIHGNEASGVQAAMAVAWYLAASQDEETRELLRKVVVLIDPVQNPDGYARFTGWVTQAHGRVPVSDPAGRELDEAWPGARGNHYYFDLSQDWLPLQQPESVNRESFLEQYRPQVMTDHHALGGDTQQLLHPDLESSGNRLISQENLEISKALGEFHTRALDRARQLEYSDDTLTGFVSGKGAVWADLQGAVGLVFEQPSRESSDAAPVRGLAALPVAIHNQVIATLATIQGARELADDLEAYRRAHARGELNPRGLPAGWIFDDGGDPGRGSALMDVLARQGLDVFGIGGSLRVGDHTYQPGHAWVVPLLGPRAPLAQALFDTSTDPDNPPGTAWSLQYAFGVHADRLTRTPTGLEPEAVVERDYVLRGPSYAEAWVLPWDDYFAPAVLYRLQRAGVPTHVALEAFVGVSSGRKIRFAPGAIIVREADVPPGDERPVDLVSRLAGGDSPLIGLDPGSPGADRAHPLGPRTLPLDLPRVALVAGRGVNPTAAGAVWHELDYRLSIPVTQVRPDALNGAVLARHTHLVMVDGVYDRIPETFDETLMAWVENGGVLVLTERAARWAQTRGWLPLEEGEEAKPEEVADTAPAGWFGSTHVGTGSAEGKGAATAETVPRDAGASSGQSGNGTDTSPIEAVLAVELDAGNPLSFGIRDASIGLVRRGPVTLTAPDGAFTVVGAYGAEPLLNGTLPEDAAASLEGRPAILAVPRGRGAIIAFAEDPAYRGVWWVGQRLLSNAVAFGSLIHAPIEP